MVLWYYQNKRQTAYCVISTLFLCKKNTGRRASNLNVIERLRKVIANTVSLSNIANSMVGTGKNDNKKSVYNDGGQFSPSNPMTPAHQGFNPWQYEYAVGSNLVVSPRTESNGALVPFNVLRNVAQNHDVTALCIKMMIDQVCGDEWDIVVADKNDREHHEDDVKAVKAFFARPDKVHLFNDWLKPILYDCLSIDAACIYKRRTRSGKLYSLEYVDGSSVKPLIDQYGRVPLPPYAAYQQIIYGIPYGSSEKTEAKELGFTINDISYRPRYPRTFSLYGTSPVETILMKINIALRRDSMNLQYYTDGTTPDGGIFTFDKDDMTVDQIQQFATLYNDIMAGRLKERFKLKFLPKGTYTATKEHKFDVEYDEWIARIVAIAFGVNPQQFIMMMNRSTGQLQDEQQTELGLAPLENFLNEWFTDIIQNELGYPHLKFAYIGEKRDDAAMSINRDVNFVQSGILTIDEVRSQRGMPPITGLKEGTPPMVKVGNDVILLTEEYIKAKTEAQLQALQFGNVQAGNQSDLEAKIREAGTAEKPLDTSHDAKGTSDDKTIVGENKNATKATQDELRAFRTFVTKRLKKKIVGGRRFEPKVISNELCEKIYKQIEKTSTVSEIDSVFAMAEYEVLVNEAIVESRSDLENVFNDIKQYIEDMLSELQEDDFNQNGNAKKYLLLLLLLGDYDYRTKIHAVMTNVLNRYIDIIIDQIKKEVRTVDGKITRTELNAIKDQAIKDRLNFLDESLNRVTEEKLGNAFITVQNVNEIKQVLASNYALSMGRAENIALTEFHNMQNEIAIGVAQKVEQVKAVFVTDGILYDAMCASANGSVWSIDYAMANPLEHPRCVRQFHLIGQSMIDLHGGIDEE